MVFQNYALFPHMTRAQNVGVRAGDARRAGRRDRRRAWQRALRPRAADGAGAQAAGPAVRRPAAARGDRARDRDRAAADADGRAAVEPRRQAAAGDARRDPPHPPRARPRDDLRHARPGRGAVARRPHRRDEGRRRAADRRRRSEVYAQPANLHVARFMGYRNVLRRSTSPRDDGDRVSSAAPDIGAHRHAQAAARRQACGVAIRPEEIDRRRRPARTTHRRPRSTTSNTAAAIRWSTS